jgi:alpha-tubulin suppressor-like RCC1 family protein
MVCKLRRSVIELILFIAGKALAPVILFLIGVSLSGCFLNASVTPLESTTDGNPLFSAMKIYLDSTQVTLAEGSFGIVNVALQDHSDLPVEVNISLDDPNHHLQPIQSTISIPAGSLSRQIVLQSIDDNVYQGNQNITLTISSSDSQMVADPNTLIIHLIDNDLPPVIQALDGSKGESQGNMVFPVTIDRPSIFPVSFNYSTRNGTALAGSDYMAVSSGQLVIPPGQTTGTIQIPLINDGISESNEIFYLDFSNPTQATLGTTQAQETIVDDDDDDVNISVNDVTVSENSGSAVFTISISKVSIHDVQVSWTTANGTALAGTNFTSSSGVATIASGATSTTVTVPILDTPALCDGNRLFYVNLSSPANGVIIDNQGVGTIQENDYPVISIASTSIEEGLIASPAVSLSQACGQTLTVEYSTSDNTAIGFLDFFAVSNLPLTFSPGVTSVKAPVTTFNDSLTEGTEDFLATLSNPSLGTLGTSTATVTITDNDVTRVAANDIAQVKTGNYHTCVLTNSGVMKCWGKNDAGQLGRGTTSIQENIPAVVTGLGGAASAISVASMAYTPGYSCAVVGGAAKCWGYNGHGQLGNGSTTNSSSPVSVTGLSSNVTDISTAITFACAIVNGGVKCWGNNAFGQLGNGTTTSSTTPVDVTGLGSGSGVTSISAGSGSACAVLGGAGGIKCWGRNDYGQLGNNSTTDSTTPVNVIAAAPGPTKVATARYQSCAIFGGGLQCWGANGWGQLGNGNFTSQLTPVPVTGLTSNVIDFDVGGDDNQGNSYVCAVVNTGAVLCWGRNYFGYAFGPSGTSQSNVPFAHSSITSGATSISVSAETSCAKIGSSVKCWGYDTYGVFARVGHSFNLKPFDNLFSSNVTQFSIGDYGTSCVVVNGGAKCFGSNNSGSMGSGSFNSSPTPTDVVGMTSNVSKVSISGNYGDGYTHTCGLTTSGALQCWGSNAYGQVGDNSNTVRSSPVTIFASGVQDFEVASTGNHSCAITTSGGLKCWGRNHMGQLGIGSTTNSLVPTDVTGLSSGVTQVTAGKGHTCAIVNGGVKCWGSNGYGELGAGSTGASVLTPQDVPGLGSGVTYISAGGLVSNSKTCVVQNGGVKCWGDGSGGALGNGTLSNMYSPTQVTGLTSGISKVKVNEYDACALTTTGALKCWGLNSNGEMGNGNLTQSLTPVDVPGMQSGVLDFDIGRHSVCILALGNSMKCWGENYAGALGLGYAEGSATPVEILFP